VKNSIFIKKVKLRRAGHKCADPAVKIDLTRQVYRKLFIKYYYLF